VGGDEPLPLRHATRGRETGDVDRLLERDRQPEERCPFSTGGGLVGGSRSLAGAVEVPHDHDVETPIVSLDPTDVEIGQLTRRHFAGAERVEQLGSACERINGRHGSSLSDAPIRTGRNNRCQGRAAERVTRFRVA
jgi:hypothetical protein